MTIDIDIIHQCDAYGKALCYVPRVAWTLTDKDRLTPEQMNEIKRDLERMLTERLVVS